MQPRYRASQSIIQELAEYAATEGVKLAIEPVKNWETPSPNMVSEVLDFLDSIETSSACGITVDTAQVLLESQGPATFKQNVARAASQDRLSYVHVSAPDRGKLRDCWIPWDIMLGEFEPVYRGPYLIEVFNAIPPLDGGMRMTRRRFWRPREDVPEPGRDSAYDVASAALLELRERIASFGKNNFSSATRAPE
jgi:sugar phosphate isomerase/epimerase